ncbi:MAG TPA: hypothetical protein VGZ72_08410, partial [Stellaceae bacterium]|nr:hypothetical protein [Stellaceae bacterium]
RLLCGDSTVAADVERVLGGVEPHLMVTDPPYGVNYDPAQSRDRAGQRCVALYSVVSEEPLITRRGLGLAAERAVAFRRQRYWRKAELAEGARPHPPGEDVWHAAG